MNQLRLSGRATLLSCAIALLLLGAAFVLPAPAGREIHPSPAMAVTQHPNIVLFLTDDQRSDTLGTVNGLVSMPHVQQLLSAHGITFTNSYVVNPLCCPSRTSILTGDYSHTTGVYLNSGNHGGFGAFNDSSTIATWLQSAGYQSGLYGKYLNGYVATPTDPYTPPGWTHFSAFSGASNEGGAYYDYTLNTDGSLVSYGSTVADYSTDVLAAQANTFIQTATAPFFLYFAPFGPHAPFTPAPRDAHDFTTISPWRPPSFNEPDVSDKPAWVQALPLLPQSKINKIDKSRIQTYQALESEDDAVNTLVTTLQATGKLHKTIFVFASDNGAQWGEHRLTGKIAPYQESVRVPLIIRYDPLTSTPRTDDHLVANIDYAPTFAELGGVSNLASGAEGMSLMPLLQSPSPSWRSDFLVEHLNDGGANDKVPTYCSVQSVGYSYVKYQTGEEELYDLAQDPNELQNVAGDASYASTLDALRAEEQVLCNPPPPGFTP